ncbi:hypothetical protein SEVIR_9G051100v4 [Setaria viridis]|uniref:DUF1618 domain-containing protein n=1 Tax=Setaria viridis TaxID=4556 RepID=A0A4U6SUC7_SETVI|nr:uncharacterized protein LOC117841099 [Setaria viridis]TKV90772.1 hypothetical protein SEVIR_9G051100v2 [Setaria viridis]
MRFPHLTGSFKAEVMFESKVFWADLSRGLAYCDLRLRGTGNSAVQFDFGFIELPYGYEILFKDLPVYELTEPPEMNRTIGCVGGCIKFICIDRPRGHPCNVMVRAWTLDLDRKEWKAEKGFLWKELWEQVAFMFTDHAELWDVEPRYPVLMPDGTLCLMLGEMRPRRREEVDCIVCRFDMRSKRPLWHGTVVDYHIMWPVILPGNFFTKCYPPPCPRENKLPARKRRRQQSIDRDL